MYRSRKCVSSKSMTLSSPLPVMIPSDLPRSNTTSTLPFGITVCSFAAVYVESISSKKAVSFGFPNILIILSEFLGVVCQSMLMLALLKSIRVSDLNPRGACFSTSQFSLPF